MKRILYLHAGAELYGADRVLLALIAGLDKTKYEAHVILPGEGELVAALQEAGAKVEILPYPILRRQYFHIKGIAEYILAYQKYAKEIAGYAKEHDIDLIHNNTAAVLEGIYVSRKIQKPLLWHIHEIIISPKIIYRFIAFCLKRYADKVICVSHAVKEHYKKIVGEERLAVIYNGVDNQAFYPEVKEEIDRARLALSIPTDAKVVGMIGRVNAWKGQDDFLDAMLPILQDHPDTYAILVGGVFAGQEWRMENLQERIAGLSVAKQIRCLDFQADTNRLYNLMDVFVLPSILPDPLPTVVLEAMACGKPVAAYHHGGVCEMVKEGYNGLLAKPRDRKALEGCIRTLLEDEEMVRSFGQHSLQRQKELFSKDGYIQAFTRLYDATTK